MLNLEKLRIESQNEDKYWDIYKTIYNEFDRIEAQLIEEINNNVNDTKKMKYRNTLNEILSSHEPYDVEPYNFYEHYKSQLC